MNKRQRTEAFLSRFMADLFVNWFFDRVKSQSDTRLFTFYENNQADTKRYGVVGCHSAFEDPSASRGTIVQVPFNIFEEDLNE